MPRLFLLIACLSLGSGNLVFAQDAKILVAKLRERLSSIQSIDMTVDATQTKVRFGLPEAPPYQERWVKYGSRERCELSSAEHSSIWMYNGRLFIEPHKESEGKKIYGARILHALPEDARSLNSPIILGLRSNYSWKSLAELLSHPTLKTKENLDINGLSCPVLTATEPVQLGTLTTEVAFDPTHDYAPIQIKYSIPDGKSFSDPRFLPNDRYEVLEWYEDVIPKVSIPKSVHLSRAEAEWSFDITQVSNKNITLDQFEQKLPDGILVNEVAVDGTHREYYTGGVEAVKKRLDEIRVQTKAELALAQENGVVFDASPQRTGYRWLWITAAVTAVIGFLLLKRK